MQAKISKILIAILLLISLLVFFFHNRLGILLGYRMNGGAEEADIHAVDRDVILHQYYNELDTYDRWRDSDNPTAQEWARSAKERADILAEQYNELVGEMVLN